MDATAGIHEGNERFMEGVRAADSASMPSLYTDDAIILPPNADAVCGADAIAKYWKDFFELGVTEARPVTLEVTPMGEYAVEVGEYSVYGADRALLDQGKIMVLWKNDGGTWKMHRDTWNTSTPR